MKQSLKAHILESCQIMKWKARDGKRLEVLCMVKKWTKLKSDHSIEDVRNLNTSDWVVETKKHLLSFSKKIHLLGATFFFFILC